jgi:solute carrier family 8 (sodium/calcium exchanger)
MLPLFGDAEQEWPNWIRGILYLLGLGWFFLGVALASDIFMGSIEKITSKKRRVWSDARKGYLTVTVWNATVANLTLMALGSSAPEILLNIVDLLGKNDMYNADLGPSTIVGSAAFNLFCITAVCVSSIPEGEVRYIKDTKVFFVTATCSIFAYIWLLCIVSGPWSRDVIELWEGALTFIFFPILVAIAFCVDQQGKPDSVTRMSIDGASPRDLANMEMEILRKYGAGLPDSEVAALVSAEYAEPASRASYRIGAIRRMSGGKRVERPAKEPAVCCTEGRHSGSSNETPITVFEDPGPKQKQAYVEFVSDKYAVLENCGTVSVTAVCHGETAEGAEIRVPYRTRDGDAKANEDFIPVEGELEFSKADEQKAILVTLIDDSSVEKDECFYVDLLTPRVNDNGVQAMLGEKRTASIRIVDDDLPGEFSFEKEELHVRTEDLTDINYQVVVERRNGCCGTVSCKYRTEADTAVAQVDFLPVTGELQFSHGQATATIDVTILARGRYDANDSFRIVLSGATGGASFSKEKDGGSSECGICTIVIETDQFAKDRVDRLRKVLASQIEKTEVAHRNWKEQFIAALYVNGGDVGKEKTAEISMSENAGNSAQVAWAVATQAGEDTDTSLVDWIMHVLTIFWKLLFACIPPADYCGGWLCFTCSLIMIGAVTAFIGDLAGLLGCVWEIPEAITAVTFVALGTSLPDTFASKTAAEQDTYADASVGNVTGSNSVNVFLGIGMPWLAGAIFWSLQGESENEARFKVWHNKYRRYDGGSVTDNNPKGDVFVVLSGSLGYSVVVFSVCALIALAVLQARRMHPLVQAELGGPTKVKYATSVFLVLLWFVFVVLYSVKVVEELGDCD